MFQTLTDGEGVDLGPGVGYTLLCELSHNYLQKYQMSHKFLLPENIWGKCSKELVFGSELEGHLQAERMLWG